MEPKHNPAENVSNYALKTRDVELVTSGVALHVGVSLDALEAARVATAPLMASVYGLEVICGASCEVGAQ